MKERHRSERNTYSRLGTLCLLSMLLPSLSSFYLSYPTRLVSTHIINGVQFLLTRESLTTTASVVAGTVTVGYTVFKHNTIEVTVAPRIEFRAQPSTDMSTPATGSPLSRSFIDASSAIDDLTRSLVDYSRVSTPEPSSHLPRCQCDTEDSEYTRAWLAVKAKLESRLVLSAGAWYNPWSCPDLG